MIARRLVRTLFPISKRQFSNSSNNDFSSVIFEFNKEMEAVFGEEPPISLPGSSNNHSTTEDSQLISPKNAKNELGMSRIGCKLLPTSGNQFSNGSINDISSVIDEFNKEMETTFGEAPPTTLDGSIYNPATSKDSNFISAKNKQKELHLSHIGPQGDAKMVDVSLKKSSERVAIATCKVLLGKEVFNLVSANQIAKGDVLTVAKIAGIIGAKQTSNLIPLCHNINLTHVRVDLALNSDDFSVEIEGEAASSERTGVEMEALTAVTVAGLTVYDMCKAASKDICITNVRLERKIGGKSGDWSREK